MKWICCFSLLCFNFVKVWGFSSPATTNKVTVSVSTELPNISLQEAHQAWLEFTWKSGGGLPILVIPNNQDDSRRLLPLFAKEELLQVTREEGCIVQQYTLTELGPIWKSEIEDKSHLGTVSFQEMESGTRLQWNVIFTTMNRQDLWQSVTDSTIMDACQNLKAYLDEPLLFQKTCKITTNSSAKDVADKWFEFIWVNGGGLPIPAFSLSKNKYDRVIVPPFLKESVVEITNDEEETDIIYKVQNPSIFTYQVYTHIGRVRFESEEDGIKMTWEVNIRPYRGLESFVKGFTEFVINALTRNFLVYIDDNGDDSMVDVYPPRGFMKDKGALFQVKRNTWIGSVLEQHMKDDKSVLEQTRDLLMPWTWGHDAQSLNNYSWSKEVMKD